MHLVVNFRPAVGRHSLEQRTKWRRDLLSVVPHFFHPARPSSGQGFGGFLYVLEAGVPQHRDKLPDAANQRDRLRQSEAAGHPRAHAPLPLRLANTVARTCPEICPTPGPRSLLSNGGQLRAQIESRNRCLLTCIPGLGCACLASADCCRFRALHFSEATSRYGDPQAGSGRGFDVMELSNPAKRGATP
jgi:hypothetical protein